MNGENENPACQLPPNERVCTGNKCASCGWNVNVERVRKWYIRRFGLTKSNNGTSRLIIRK